MFCLFCVMAGTVAGGFYWNSSFARLIFDSWVHDPTRVLDPARALEEFTPGKQLPPDKQHVVTVLLLGCDKDYDERRPVPLKDSRGRSDAILIARVDFDNQTISALSIPRDTAVEIPGRNGVHKINAAHAYGGPELTRETIRSVFGIDADYYATLDFDGFQKVVDALGGIEVNVQKAMKYDDNWGNLHIDLKPGLQTLTGYQAMGYVRMRHNDSDMARAERQQQFLEALRGKVKDPRNFLKLPGVLEAIATSIQSNMTQGQMLALGNFARTLQRENIELATLPVTPTRSFVYAKVEEGEQLLRALFNPDGLTPVSINVPARREVVSRRGGSRSNPRRVQPPAEEMISNENAEEEEEETPPSSDETMPPSETFEEGSSSSPSAKPENGSSGSGAESVTGDSRSTSGVQTGA